MTIDDDSSIYVGGLPYDCTEENLRRTFDIYGAVVAVKIINDREVGGKCYGFVTFRNPRSASNAIAEMNGRTIGGRPIKVNEVRTRGGRQNFNRENFRRFPGREIERERDRERDHSRDRDRFWDRNNDFSHDRNREQEQEFEHHDHDRIRDQSLDKDGDHEEVDQDSVRKRVKNWDRDGVGWNHEEADRKDYDRNNENDRNKHSTRHRIGQFNDPHSRELSPNSSEELEEEARAELQVRLERREEIQKEIDELQEKVNDKDKHVLDLEKKSQKLEEALIVCKKLSSRQKARLLKLHKSFLQVQDCTERLKSSEQELQLLLNETKIGIDGDDDIEASL